MIDISKVQISKDAKNILEYLLQDYKTLIVSKQELAKILHVSESTIDNYIARNHGIPQYKKLGESKNSKIIFNLIDVAEFLAQKVGVKNA